jgi:hypothetical protein
LPTTQSVAGTPITSAARTPATMNLARRGIRRKSDTPPRTPARVPSTSTSAAGRDGAAGWAACGAGSSVGRGVAKLTRVAPRSSTASQCGHRRADVVTAWPQWGHARGIDLR